MEIGLRWRFETFRYRSDIGEHPLSLQDVTFIKERERVVKKVLEDSGVLL